MACYNKEIEEKELEMKEFAPNTNFHKRYFGVEPSNRVLSSLLM